MNKFKNLAAGPLAWIACGLLGVTLVTLGGLLVFNLRFADTRMTGVVLASLAILLTLGAGLAAAGVAISLQEDKRVLRAELALQQQADEEGRRKTALLLAQVNSLIDGILAVDPDGKKLLQSQRLIELLKIPSPIADGPGGEDLLRWVADLVKHPGQFMEKIVYLNAHPQEVSRDEIELQDGTIVDHYSAPIVGQDSTCHGRIWMFRDITARKRLEAQFSESQKMESVGKLAGGIAHEFNSILTAIIGQSDLLLRDLPKESPLAKNAAEIRKAADWAAALTGQLLAYGRKQILQPQVLDLNAVLTKMEGTLRHLLGRDTSVSITPASGLGAVRVDAGQIEQVIMNMAITARDAMPKGGKLTLETANVWINAGNAGQYRELKPGHYVLLTITDTGKGMSAEVKARVFEPFFSAKAAGPGTGLGLSTCYGIIKQSGGHISVTSEPDRGATFKIYLPQAEPQQPTPPPRPPSPDLPAGTETILLVEADAGLREMAAALLTRLGYTVLTAVDALEGLHLERPVDLLLTDVIPPDQNGRPWPARVWSLSPRTRILWASAGAENGGGPPASLAAGVALLPKPFTPSALARKLREVLEGPGAPPPGRPAGTSIHEHDPGH